MILFVTVSLFWFFVAALGAPPQTSRSDWSLAEIPNVTRDGRRCDVHLDKFLIDNKVYISCNFPLPTESWKFYAMSQATLCFGMYDTLYELCRHQTLSLKLPAYRVDHFCEKASKALVSYNFKRSEPVLREWAKHLKTALNNTINCTDLCLHEAEVNPECAMIVAAMEQLPDATTTASKPSRVTSSVEASRSSTASVFQNSPSSPYKASDPLPAKGKSTAPVDPVAPLNTNQNPKVEEEGSVKHETTDNSPPVDGKPESPANPDNKASEPEPKVENAELDNPMEPMGAEDEDISAMEAQAQPDTPGAQPDTLPKEPREKSREDENLVKPEAPMLLPEDRYVKITDGSEETNMVTYFVLMTGGALLLYVAFHNKNKLLALALEGRRTGRRGGRHSSAAYSKLHSNLEETIASGPTSPSAMHVLY